MGTASLDAEQALLGGVLIDATALADALDHVTADDFDRPAHRAIFRAMTSLYEESQASDVVAVAARLNGHLDEVGGAAYLAQLHKSCPTSIHVGQYAQIVAEAARRRRIAEEATRRRRP